MSFQKEAFFFKKHCVTLRDETEWVELVQQGYNVITGANKSRIKEQVDIMSTKKSNFDKNLYGNGKASEVIADFLKKIKD